MSGKSSASVIRPEFRVFPDPPSLAWAAAETFISLAAKSIASGGLFSVALAGGSTPRRLHKVLADSELAAQVEWEKVHVFWGDERCVPADHPESNYCMARETLLEHVPIPPANIHPVQGKLQPSQAAEAYEAELQQHFGPHALPVFNLILLGLGEDGHTASLFPGATGLLESQRWVIAVEHREPPAPLVDRVTFTPLLINAAEQVVFLVAGEAKSGRVAQVLKGSYQPDILPAQLIRPEKGALVWLLDATAAAGLE